MAAEWWEIRVKGRLEGEQWRAWFAGLTVSPAGEDETAIAGLVADQAALHGVLGRVRDLGLLLLSVRCLPVEPD